MKPFLNHKTYFTKEEYLKNVQFPYTLHLLGAGTGAAYFWLRLHGTKIHAATCGSGSPALLKTVENYKTGYSSWTPKKRKIIDVS